MANTIEDLVEDKAKPKPGCGIKNPLKLLIPSYLYKDLKNIGKDGKLAGEGAEFLRDETLLYTAVGIVVGSAGLAILGVAGYVTITAAHRILAKMHKVYQ